MNFAKKTDMKNKMSYGDISEFLGPKENRYFSNGFKSMNIRYSNIVQNDGSLSVTIQAETGSNWSKKNKQNMSPHLGTTEFIAISAMISQLLLEKEMRLSNDEIEQSWISRFMCKIKQCTEVDQRNISVTGKILSTEPLAGFLQSQIRVQIGTMQVTLFICHPYAGSLNRNKKETDSVNLYTNGYKMRDHAVTGVVLDMESKTSSADVSINEEKNRMNGIGAKYSGMILTDFILVTGQLAQVLLYNLNGNAKIQIP